MQRSIFWGMALFSTLLLTACMNHTFYHSEVQDDLSQENWIHHVKLNSNNWTAHADAWFYNDEPSDLENYKRNAPANTAVTAMAVRVPDFTHIMVDGPYKLQIYGGQTHNSLFVLGSNEAARHTAVEVSNDTVYIHPAKECASRCTQLDDVIIRIGIRDLQGLQANGTGFIEGKFITSSGLDIRSVNQNEILLAGNMAVQHIDQYSPGSLSLIGAYSPEVDVRAVSSGDVNLSGRIGIRNVLKQGSGNLSILGADTDGLYLQSSGTGMTVIAGFANLKSAEVMGSSRVYLYWVTSDNVTIHLRDDGRLGVAGKGNELELNVKGRARFYGKYFRVNNAYVTTTDYAHANVVALQKLYANASNNSSIYYFGAPNAISRYVSGNAIVMPIVSAGCPVPVSSSPRGPLYKDAPPISPAPRAYPRRKPLLAPKRVIREKIVYKQVIERRMQDK